MAVKAKDHVTLTVLPSPSYVRLYYLKQASTLNPPVVPTTNPPPAAWSTTEPAYTEGSTDTLYTVMVTAYGSVSFEYGPVQKSASFEAAKQAYNKAVAAGTAAAQALSVANLSVEQLAHALDSTPPTSPAVGAVWYPRNESGDITGMWQWNGSAWGTHATLTGLLLVPTADGGQTLIGPNGVEAVQMVADILRSKVLYADVAGIQTLVITDIPRENLASDVGEALASAEDLADRIILESGTITISKNAKDSTAPLTAMRLGATTLDFIAADKNVAYIDSTLEQMSIANVLVRDTFVIGSCQARELPGTGVTVFQQITGV